METIFLREGKEKEKDEKYHGQGKIVRISGRTDLKGFAKGPGGP